MGKHGGTEIEHRAATTRTARPALQQRGVDAARALGETVHLPTNPSDVNVLGTALAEAAAQEAKHNARFASEIRRRYEELLTFQRVTTSTQKQKDDLPPLIPL